MSDTTDNDVTPDAYTEDDRSLAADDRDNAAEDRYRAVNDRVRAEDVRVAAADDRRVNRDSLALVASSISQLNTTMAQMLDRLPAVEAKADSTQRRVNVMSVFLVILILIGITNIYNGLALRGQGDLAQHQQDDITALAQQIKDCTNSNGKCYQENRNATSGAVSANEMRINEASARILAELHEQNRQQMIVNCALLRSNGVDMSTVPPCAGL